MNFAFHLISDLVGDHLFFYETITSQNFLITMQFKYKALEKTGETREGIIETVNMDVAITSLQRRGLVVSSVEPIDEGGSIFSKDISLFSRVSNKDIVILSNQLSTLFEAQVSALRIFKLLGAEAEKPMMRKVLSQVADDLQGGSSISKAISRHPKVFSPFYVNMVKAGEEAGKLDQTFTFLSEHLERTYEVTSKAKNALIYPAFVIFTFVAVMVLMLTKVIPSISQILVESGQEIPIYTKVVLGISDFFVGYGPLLGIFVIAAGVFLWRFGRTERGRFYISMARLKIPYLGTLYRKLFLSRLTSNLNTMLQSAIPIVKAIEITSDVVDDAVFSEVLRGAAEGVKSGNTLSSSLARYEGVPTILVQMIRVGEETGELGNVLKTMSRFYEREVVNAVDTLVGLIEPLMIVLLGLGVGFLLTSVLVPIYNISSGMA